MSSAATSRHSSGISTLKPNAFASSWPSVTVATALAFFWARSATCSKMPPMMTLPVSGSIRGLAAASASNLARSPTLMAARTSPVSVHRSTPVPLRKLPIPPLRTRHQWLWLCERATLPVDQVSKTARFPPPPLVVGPRRQHITPPNRRGCLIWRCRSRVAPVGSALPGANGSSDAEM